MACAGAGLSRCMRLGMARPDVCAALCFLLPAPPAAAPTITTGTAGGVTGVGSTVTSGLTVTSSGTDAYALGGVVVPASGATIVIRGSGFSTLNSDGYTVAVTAKDGAPGDGGVTGLTAAIDSDQQLTITRGDGALSVMAAGAYTFTIRKGGGTPAEKAITLTITTVAAGAHVWSVAACRQGGAHAGCRAHWSKRGRVVLNV